MKHVLIITGLCFTFNIILVSGSSLSDKVDQAPTDIYGKQGETAEITCSHKIDNYNRILWYKQLNRNLQFLGYLNINKGYPEDGVDVTIDGDANKGRNCTLTINSLSVSSSAVYFCAASYGTGGPQTEPAYFGKGTKLTVLETDRTVTPPTKVKIFPPSAKECRNKKDDIRKKTLVCVASGFYPDHVSVSWEKNGKVVPDSEAKDRQEKYGVATDSAAKRVGEFYRITSRLRVPAAHYNTPGNTFTCIVSFYNGTQNVLRHASIDSIKGESEGGMTREKYLKHTQSAKLSYGVLIVKSCIYGAFIGFLVWKLQGSSGKHNN
nr:T cell receptor beta chain VDJC [Stegastes partitus]